MINALTRHVSIGALAAVVIVALLYVAGLRLNLTASLPLGVYWRTYTPLARGSYVMFCPPVSNPAFGIARTRHYIDYGTCSGRYEMLLKRIAGLEGDQVDMDEAGVRVNGVLIANSAPRAADRLGRPLPVVRLHTRLMRDDLLLMSNHSPWSFDARYFGPIERDAVRAHVNPVWTW